MWWWFILSSRENGFKNYDNSAELMGDDQVDSCLMASYFVQLELVSSLVTTSLL